MKGSKENSIKPHILIVGSGIIGKFNAIELSQLGFKITIADPHKSKSSSRAALGMLMGHIYQKRKGRSWILRDKSNQLWPKWIKFLRDYNNNLCVEKPLTQLTTNKQKFEKMIKFVAYNPNQDLKILRRNSNVIKNINKIFNINNLMGIISLRDGRVDPILLLKSLDICIKDKNINLINDEVIKVNKINNQWIATFKNKLEIRPDVIVLCNSLNALKLINTKKHNIKLKPVLGQAIEISANDKEINFLSLPKHFSVNNKNLIPINKDKIIIGSTDEYDIQPKENIFDELTDFLENKPKWLNKNKITNKWYGIRSRPDGEGSPILKSLEKGLILCTGFYKNGILLAPACSDWISKEISKHLF